MLTIVIVSAAIAFVFWASDVSLATHVAMQALQSDARVFVNAENGWVAFFPAENPNPETGFIFYPDGRVDYRAYAPVLRLIAERGYFVVLVPAPLNLPFFNVNVSARVIAHYPEIQQWAVGGHSLGGVAASSYAANHPDIKGLVLWASYPANDALKPMDTKAISIYGTNDGLTTSEKINESRALLPADAEFVAIEGGNHAQFASYGLQAGDNKAAISPEEQWTQIANATVEFLEGLK